MAYGYNFSGIGECLEWGPRDEENAEYFVPDSSIQENRPARDIPGASPYVCFVFAHDIDPSDECKADGMERFYYRIWADSEAQVESLFLAQTEVIEYVDGLDHPVKSVYDIDQWDALVTVIALDPRV